MYKIYTGVFMYDVCKKITACETFLRSGGKFLTTVFGDFLPSWMIYFVGHLFVIYMCSISKTVYRHLHAAWFPVTFECCSRYVLLHCMHYWAVMSLLFRCRILRCRHPVVFSAAACPEYCWENRLNPFPSWIDSQWRVKVTVFHSV